MSTKLRNVDEGSYITGLSHSRASFISMFPICSLFKARKLLVVELKNEKHSVYLLTETEVYLVETLQLPNTSTAIVFLPTQDEDYLMFVECTVLIFHLVAPVFQCQDELYTELPEAPDLNSIHLSYI